MKTKTAWWNRANLVEAYMTHASTPWITEVFANSRIRKVGRKQYFGSDGPEKMLAWIKTKYGDKWTGVRKADR